VGVVVAVVVVGVVGSVVGLPDDSGGVSSVGSDSLEIVGTVVPGAAVRVGVPVGWGASPSAGAGSC
jgi:hypothetical protein